jgi:hypothetical protein
VRVGSESVSAAYQAPGGPVTLGLAVFAHGAGGHLADRGLLESAEILRESGLGVVRFNFRYREQRRRFPDPMPNLLDEFAAVVGRALVEVRPPRLFLGGRSMGGRAATMLAADGFPCDGLILMAYPLHAPGRPDRLRSDHLPRIGAPVLCFNGTRDPFCRRDLMGALLPGLGPHWTMHWLEDADHGFRLPRSSGRTAVDVREEIRRALSAWLARVAA